MMIVLYLIPVTLFLGGLGLAAFLWALRSGQYEDLEGAASRILFDDDQTLGSAPLAPKTSCGRMARAAKRPKSH